MRDTAKLLVSLPTLLKSVFFFLTSKIQKKGYEDKNLVGFVCPEGWHPVSLYQLLSFRCAKKETLVLVPRLP